MKWMYLGIWMSIHISVMGTIFCWRLILHATGKKIPVGLVLLIYVECLCIFFSAGYLLYRRCVWWPMMIIQESVLLYQCAISCKGDCFHMNTNYVQLSLTRLIGLLLYWLTYHNLMNWSDPPAKRMEYMKIGVVYCCSCYCIIVLSKKLLTVTIES